MARKKQSPPQTEDSRKGPKAKETKAAERGFGVLASEVKRRQVNWLFQPWIPREMLTMVVGLPGTGKSTFLSTLLAAVTTGFDLEGKPTGKRGRAVLLPGYEEDVEVLTAPRLEDVGIDPSRVRILTEDDYQLRRDRDYLARRIKEYGADLVVIDPIDSYVDSATDINDKQQVRPFLEAVGSIARKSGAAVVATRNPGKEKDNICPNSQAWRDVPRVVLLFSEDGNKPPEYTMAPWKYQIGVWPLPRKYTLTGGPNGERRFKLLEEMDHAASQLERAAIGPTHRFKLLQACKVIRWYFGVESSPTRQGLRSHCSSQGIGDDTVYDAMRLLGVASVQGESKDEPWKLTHTQPDWPQWLPAPPSP